MMVKPIAESRRSAPRDSEYVARRPTILGHGTTGFDHSVSDFLS